MELSESHGEIRPVSLDDAPVLQAIYADYVEKTVVSFETVAPSVEEFRERIRTISRDFPYLVYEKDGRVLGYAYAHKCFERKAYDWDAETTVYLDPSERGRGIGRVLYGALVDILTLLGYRNLYAIIVSENTESCSFHERNGFKLFSVFHKTGWKSGRWLDVSWYERQIGSFEGAPSPTTSISELSQSEILAICERYGVLAR